MVAQPAPPTGSAKDETEANQMLAQMITFILGQLQRHHGAQDQPGRKAARNQANTGPEVTFPSSQPQDSRVEYGEGGPLPQVT